jgi:hypothetical protein
MANQEYPDLPFVPPRAFGRGRAGYAVQYVVVHYTAGSERSTSAEDGAAYDQRRTDGTSTHYFVDSNSVVQCVYTWDRANAAYQYGNRLGIQYELCGTVQTRAQWLDAASDATLTNAAWQIARDCRKYGLPVRRLTTQQMRNGEKGICGHVDVTNAYGLGDHTDPGPQFPWDVLLARVAQFLAPSTPEATPQTPHEEDEMRMFKAGGADGKVAYALVHGFEARVYRRDELGKNDSERDSAANVFSQVAGQAAIDCNGDAWNALMKEWGVSGHNFVRSTANGPWVLEPRMPA